MRWFDDDIIKQQYASVFRNRDDKRAWRGYWRENCYVTIDVRDQRHV